MTRTIYVRKYQDGLADLFDNGKPVQTRSGKPARIICLDSQNTAGYVVVALVKHDDDDNDMLERYTKDGRFVCPSESLEPHPYDLVNRPEKIQRTVWLNIYEETTGNPVGISVHKTKEVADKFSAGNRLACIPVNIDTVKGAGL